MATRGESGGGMGGELKGLGIVKVRNWDLMTNEIDFLIFNN